METLKTIEQSYDNTVYSSINFNGTDKTVVLQPAGLV